MFVVIDLNRFAADDDVEDRIGVELHATYPCALQAALEMVLNEARSRVQSELTGCLNRLRTYAGQLSLATNRSTKLPELHLGSVSRRILGEAGTGPDPAAFDDWRLSEAGRRYAEREARKRADAWLVSATRSTWSSGGVATIFIYEREVMV